MLDDNFEKYLKKNLEAANVSWDKENMWDSIEEKLPKKSNRRAFFVLFGVGLYLLIFICGVFIGSQISNSNENPYLNLTKVVAVTENSQIDSTFIESSNRNNEIHNNDAQIFDNDLEMDNDFIDRDFSESLVQEVKKRNTVNLDNLDKINSTSVQIGLNAGSMSDHYRIGLDDLILMNDSNTEVASDLPVPNIVSRNIALEYSDLPLIGSVESEFLVSNISVNKPLPSLVTNFTRVLDQAKRYQLLVNGSIGFVSRSFSSTGSIPELYEARVESEKMLESYSGGLSYRFFINNSLFLESGLEYRRINEKLNYTEINVDQNEMLSDSAYYFINRFGSLQYVADNISVVSTRRRSNLIYNNHVQWLMPVRVGMYRQYGAISFVASTGPVLLLHSRFNGAFIEDDLSLSEKKSHDDILQGLIGGIDFSLSANIKVYDNIDFGLGINYRLPVGSIRTGNSIGQSYGLADIKVGFIFNL